MGTRLRLAELMAVPGELTAFLPSDFPGLALPSTQDHLASVCEAIEFGLEPETVEALAGHRLGEVCPATGHMAGGPADAGTLTLRLRNTLETNKVATWAALSRLRLREVSAITNVGPKAVAALLRGAVRAANEFVGASLAGPSDPGTDVQFLLSHEFGVGGSDLRRALMLFDQPDQPDPVRGAAARLLTLPTGEAMEAPTRSVLQGLLSSAGTVREQVLFERLVLQLDAAPSAASMARMFGTSGQRIAAIRDRASDNVRNAALAHAEELDELTTEIVQILGVAAPLSSLGPIVERLGLRSLVDPRLLLLLWMAGPYEPVRGHAGWVALEPLDFLAETVRILLEDGGVRSEDHVRGDFTAFGLAEGHMASWLAAQPIRIIDGLLVSLVGPQLDVAERVLNATGRSMTTKQIAKSIQAAGARDQLFQSLLRDPRVLRVGPDDWELAEWGGVRFDPTVSKRVTGDPFELVIHVDESTLAGGDDTIPELLMDRLGMLAPTGRTGRSRRTDTGATAEKVGVRRTFSTRFGPLTLSFDGVTARRGSVRPIALAAGALVGDAIVVRFATDTDQAGVVLRVRERSSGSLF